MARKKADDKKVDVRNIHDVSGEINIAAGDIVKNINTIHQRALTAAEEAARGRKLESKLLAQGVSMLAQNLSAQASQAIESNNPYKGLLAYNLNEAQIFFGRNKAKSDLLNCMKQDSLTVLHAESGAGKSSLLQAGIAAQLITNGHLAIRLRPHNSDPVGFIKHTFLPNLSEAPILAKSSLHEFLRQVCTVLGPKVNLYLLLDQFEEFFNLLKKDERKSFIKSLADCLNDSSLKVRWILALRADALSDLAELELFGITPFKNTYRLNRLGRTEAQEAIIEPAKLFNIDFEQALIEHILDSLTSNGEITPTQLQLVCSALTDDLPTDKTLTLTYYTDHEGDTEGILRDYLKRQLEHFPSEEQASAWKLLRALISADRQRTVKTYDEIIQELSISGLNRTQIDTVLARLVDRRLLFMQPTTIETFELAHDYLVKEIELDPQEQARKAAQELLDQEIRLYQRHKTLLSVERLAIIDPFRNDLRFSKEGDELLRESRRVVQQDQLTREKRRRRTLAGIMIASLLIIATLAGWGITSSNQNQQLNARGTQLAGQVAVAQTEKAKAEDQAKKARAGELIAQMIPLSKDDFIPYLLLGVEAYRSADDYQTRNVLLSNLQSRPELLQYFPAQIWHSGTASNVVFSPDGRLLATGGCNFDIDDKCIDAINLWDMENRKPLKSLSTGQRAFVQMVIFSPDGKILAAASCGEKNADNKCIVGGITLWDVATSKPIGQPLKGHVDYVESIAFSPDGKMLASGSDDHTIILWDLETRQRIGQPLSQHTDSVLHLTFNPDGKTLASSGNDNNVILWDVATHQSISLINNQEISPIRWPLSMAFSPDGKTIAVGGCGNRDIHFCLQGEIVLWDAESQQKIGQPLIGHPDSIFSIAFSPDGKMLASGSCNTIHSTNCSQGEIILWNVETQQEIGLALTADLGGVISIAFSPNGKMFASGSENGIILWSVNRGNGNSVGQQLDKVLNTMVFNPDGKVLASGAGDGSVFLWNATNRQPIGQLPSGSTNPKSNLAFSLDDKVLYLSSDNQNIVQWDSKNEIFVKQLLHGETGFVSNATFSEDGSIFASCSLDKITLWEVSSGNPVALALNGICGVNKMVISSDGRFFASISSDNGITIWNIANGTQLSQLPALEAKILLSIAISPNGKFLAGVFCDDTCSGNEIVVWDVARQEIIGQPISGDCGQFDGAYCGESIITFNQNGDSLALFDPYGFTIIPWDKTHGIPSGKPQSTRFGITDSLISLAFSPDHQTLTLAFRNKTIIWNIPDWKAAGKLLTGLEPVNTMAFSPDGKTLASGMVDGIMLWNTATGQFLGQLLTENKEVVSKMIFSQDGKILVSAICIAYEKTYCDKDSKNGKIILWDVVTQTMIKQYPIGSSGTLDNATFSSDGKVLATVHDAKIIILWDVSSGMSIAQLSSEKISAISSMAFGPDGKILASGGCKEINATDNCQKGEIMLWDVQSQEPIGELLGEIKGKVMDIAFSPNGKILASGSDEGPILWDMESKLPLGQPLNEHPFGKSPADITVSPLNIAFSPDGKTLASDGCNNGGPCLFVINLWDVTEQRLSGQWPVNSLSTKLVFNPINSMILASGSNYAAGGASTVWNIDPLEWVERTCQRAGRNFTRIEWAQYFSNEKYRATCPQWPLEPEVTFTQ